MLVTFNLKIIFCNHCIVIQFDCCYKNIKGKRYLFSIEKIMS
jgi:hypothetical protein